MKNYQFIVIAIIGAAIAAALFMGKAKKKPCGCGGSATAADIEPVTE